MDHKGLGRIYMRFLSLALVLVGLSLAATSAEAGCVRVALLDESGTIIKPDGLVVGIQIGTEPVFPQALPDHHERKVVGPVECPREVIDPVRDLYNLSCASDQAMSQASVNNSQSILVVQQRCQELAAALQ